MANDIVIVAATGCGQEKDRRSHEVEFDHQLVWPFDAAEVIRLLAKEQR